MYSDDHPVLLSGTGGRKRRLFGGKRHGHQGRQDQGADLDVYKRQQLDRKGHRGDKGSVRLPRRLCVIKRIVFMEKDERQGNALL